MSQITHQPTQADPEPSMSAWGEMLKAHAVSHYEFGWDAVLETLGEADLEDFAVSHQIQGGSEEELIPAAARFFNVPETRVTDDQWAVVSRDVDGVCVSAYENESDARERFAAMVGRQAPQAFPKEFNGTSDFGTGVTISRPKSQWIPEHDPHDNSSKVIRRVVVLGSGSAGPVFHSVLLTVTQREADNGQHYDSAKLTALEAGLEDPMIAFDQFDPATVQISRIASEITAQREIASVSHDDTELEEPTKLTPSRMGTGPTSLPAVQWTRPGVAALGEPSEFAVVVEYPSESAALQSIATRLQPASVTSVAQYKQLCAHMLNKHYRLELNDTSLTEDDTVRECIAYGIEPFAVLNEHARETDLDRVDVLGAWDIPTKDPLTMQDQQNASKAIAGAVH